MDLRVHKIASVVHRLGFEKTVEVTESLEVAAGNAVVVRALREKRVYSDLELDSGRMAKIYRGDVFIGALGCRRALRGFCGDLPTRLRVGDTLQLLNRGGVVGRSATEHMDIGSPVTCEVLGMPIRGGRIANVADSRLPSTPERRDVELPPVLVVTGTCMDSGKTLFLSELIQELTRDGLAIAGGKLTGIACQRDLLAMEDHGAMATASFLDVGHTSTVDLSPARLVEAARDIVSYLASFGPDLIALELGDGLLGDYGGLELLRHEEFRDWVRMHVFCASDPVGAWGGKRLLAESGIEIDLFSGPCTDNEVGKESLEREWGIPAINAHRQPAEVAQVVRRHLEAGGNADPGIQ